MPIADRPVGQTIADRHLLIGLPRADRPCKQTRGRQDPSQPFHCWLACHCRLYIPHRPVRPPNSRQTFAIFRKLHLNLKLSNKIIYFKKSITYGAWWSTVISCTSVSVIQLRFSPVQRQITSLCVRQQRVSDSRACMPCIEITWKTLYVSVGANWASF